MHSLVTFFYGLEEQDGHQSPFSSLTSYRKMYINKMKMKNENENEKVQGIQDVLHSMVIIFFYGLEEQDGNQSPFSGLRLIPL